VWRQIKPYAVAASAGTFFGTGNSLAPPSPVVKVIPQFLRRLRRLSFFNLNPIIA
jgi:hypothetical protein